MLKLFAEQHSHLRVVGLKSSCRKKTSFANAFRNITSCSKGHDPPTLDFIVCEPFSGIVLYGYILQHCTSSLQYSKVGIYFIRKEKPSREIDMDS